MLLSATLALLVGVAHYLVFAYAPVEVTMGVVQKIFYFHVSSAYVCYLGFLLCFIGSLGYLFTRKGRWDAFALAAAETGLLFGLIVLTTGPLWARPVWGLWWVWEPRLTSLALLFLMFGAYFVLQNFGGAGEGIRRMAAALAVFATPNIYFVHVAVERWGGIHPQIKEKTGGGLTPEMRSVFFFAIATVLTLFIVLLVQRYRMHLHLRLLSASRRRVSRMGGES